MSKITKITKIKYIVLNLKIKIAIQFKKII